MRFCRRPLSIDYQADAAYRLDELQAKEEVRKILLDPTDVKAITHGSNHNGTETPSMNCNSALNELGTTSCCPLHDHYLREEDEDPYSAFPFMGACDQDGVS